MGLSGAPARDRVAPHRRWLGSLAFRPMCRSIHRLRDGREIDDREAMEEAARQYVRKVSGFTKPAAHNEAAFAAAVAEITDATERLMANLVIR